MNRNLVGEPGVSAFLRSVRQNLSGDINSWVESTIFYPKAVNDLKKLKKTLTHIQDLVIDGEARRLVEESVNQWMDDVKHLLYDVEGILDDFKTRKNDLDHLYVRAGTPKNLKKKLGKILVRAERVTYRAGNLELKRGGGYTVWPESKITLRTRRTSSMVDQQSTMNRQLVGAEPGVSASLQSALQALGDICRMKPTATTFLYYDPTQDLEKLNEELVFVQGLVVDGEAKRLADPGVDKWMDDLNGLVSDVQGILDDIKSLWKDTVRFDDFNTFSIGIKNRMQEKILAAAKELGKKARKLDLKRGIESDFWADSNVTLRTREEDKTLIVNRLLKVDAQGKKNYDVVGIWGEGGLGKTTLARLVYNDPVFEKQFEVRRWMGRAAIKGLIGDRSADDAESLKSLEKMVQNKRFFFVMDGMLSSTEWDIIKAALDPCQNGSKILVTTRDCYIAQVLGDEDPYQLKGLPHEQCMSLFVDMAFGYGETDEGKQEKLNLGKKIVRACKGVPLAVKVIGSMLQRAGSEKWRTVSEKADLWDTIDINDEIHPAIRLSYHYLPPSLKRCFEYLAVFPPDYEFEQDDVVRLWIADGLVQEVKDRMAEDTGNEYYNQLKARSLIEENNMMHDVVHHLARVVSTKFCYEENSTGPLVRVRHAFLVNLDEMHCDFFSQAPRLHTLIVEEPEDKRLLGNKILSCKKLRTLKILSKRSNSTIQLLVGGSSIGNLTHLRYLTINHSDVRHLPDSLCMLHSLQFLDLGYNEYLQYLPDGINHLSNLRLLNVQKSSILGLPDSICTLSQLQVLNLSNCDSLRELPKDIGNLRSLVTLDLKKTSIVSVPDSILNVTGLKNLLVDEHKQLPLHIGRLAGLEELPDYHVGKEEGSRLSELNLMNRLRGKLSISSMENIGGVEEAKMADLKSKKNVGELEFRWSQLGNVEEMEVKILEALEPHHALESLTFSNYGGDKFPAWIMAGNICFSNLASLRMEGLNKMCEMVDMEFVSLKNLMIENCPVLSKVLMATPKLSELIMRKCGELEADSVHLLSNLSDKAGLHSIVSQLTELECDYNIFDYFFEKLKRTNLIWEKLRRIRLSAEGTRVSLLPAGWPSMMDCLHTMDIVNIRSGKFQFIPDGDQSAFPPSLGYLAINNCLIKERLPHHSYTITSDGKVESEE